MFSPHNGFKLQINKKGNNKSPSTLKLNNIIPNNQQGIS